MTVYPSRRLSIKESINRLAQPVRQADGWIVLLLLGVTNNFLWVKLATVGVLGLLMLIRKKEALKWPPPFFFYLLMPIAGLIGAGLTGSFQVAAYPYVVLYGCLQWLISAAGLALVYNRLAGKNTSNPERSLHLFAALNLLVSLYWLGHTMWQSGSWWPYGIPDSPDYGISTGDYIQGIFGGSSVINAACSALLLLYFTQQKQLGWAATAMVCLWLCSSNLVLMLTLVLLIVQLLTLPGQRLRLLVFTLGLTLGYGLINFQNVPYLFHMSQGKAVAVRKAEPSRPKSGSASWYRFSSDILYGSLKEVPAASQCRNAADILGMMGTQKAFSGGVVPDTQAIRQAITAIYHQPYDRLPPAYAGVPLKAFALLQTIRYTLCHPGLLPFGAGMGNASSKLAMKVTGAGFHGNWPSGKAYVAPPFYAAHLQDLLYLFSQDASQHSIAHFPNNTYAQLLAEYGLVGVLLFMVLYVGFFIKKLLRSTTRLWTLVLFTGLLLATDYWLESITLVFVFETLMLISFRKPESPALPD